MPILLMVFVGIVALIVFVAAVFYTFAFFNVDLRNYPWQGLVVFLLVVLIILVIYIGKERLRAQRGLLPDARSIQRRKDRSVSGGQPIEKE